MRFFQLLADRDGDEVGVGEVAVVGRLFLAPLAEGDAALGVPAAGFFGDVAQLVARALPLVELAFGLVLDGRVDAAEAVEVFDFDDGRGDGAAVVGLDVQVDVGVAAEAAFLHVAVGDFEVGEQEFQLIEVGVSLGPGAEVGLARRFRAAGCRPG